MRPRQMPIQFNGCNYPWNSCETRWNMNDYNKSTIDNGEEIDMLVFYTEP